MPSFQTSDENTKQLKGKIKTIGEMAEPLPSGLQRLSYSMKVYRDRIRGHNEPYIPHITYEEGDWSTPALQLWVSSLIKE